MQVTSCLVTAFSRKLTKVLEREWKAFYINIILPHSLILLAAKGVLDKFWLSSSSEGCIRNNKLQARWPVSHTFILLTSSGSNPTPESSVG